MNISINIKLILKLCLLQIVFIYALETQLMQSLLALLCWFLFVYVFITKGSQKALYVLTIIGILSFDQSGFAFENKETQLVNFFALPVLGLYPFVTISVLLFFKSLREFSLFQYKREKLKCKRKSVDIITYVIIFLIIGFVVGLLNARNVRFNIDAFKYDVFRFVITLIYIPIYGYYLNDRNVVNKYIELIFNFLIVCGLTSLFSILSGHVGYYGAEREFVPLNPLYSVFCTSLIAFYSSVKKKSILLLIFVVLNILLTVLFGNALGGKAWIILCFSILFVAIVTLKSKYAIFLFVMFTFIIMNVGSLNLLTEESVSSNKFDEFISAINIFDPNWYSSMSGSPKFRIDEFINVFIEYKENPQYFLFGKGIGGYINDHTHTFGMFNSAAFDDLQYIKGEFYSLHESINVIFLKFGGLGLFFFLCMVCKLFITSFKSKNPYLLIGSFWLLFFVSYSYELMFFGAPCLTVGLRIIDNKVSV
jgi:hypothetical protein